MLCKTARINSGYAGLASCHLRLERTHSLVGAFFGRKGDVKFNGIPDDNDSSDEVFDEVKLHPACTVLVL